MEASLTTHGLTTKKTTAPLVTTAPLLLLRPQHMRQHRGATPRLPVVSSSSSSRAPDDPRPSPRPTCPPAARNDSPEGQSPRLLACVHSPARLPATCVDSPSCPRLRRIEARQHRQPYRASLLRFVDDSPADDSPTDIDTMSLLTGLDASAAAATRSLDFASRVGTALSLSPDGSPLPSELQAPPIASPV